MFNSTTRPPPPSGRPPPYAFVSRVYKRTLRPVVIFFGFLACIWAWAWAIECFEDINDKSIPKLKPFNIAAGCLYAGVAIVEMYGIFAAWKSSIPLMRIYCWLSVVSLVMVSAAEMIGVVLHFTMKGDLIRDCAEDLEGANYFDDGFRRVIDQEEAEERCDAWWGRRSFTEIAWFVVVLLLGLLFLSVTWSFYRQLLDPSSVRTTTSTNVYRLESRTPYAPHGPIPGYQPYNNYPDYVPPYDPHKLPDYRQSGYSGPSGDPPKEGTGYGVGATGNSQGYTVQNPRRDSDETVRDEGFDPAAIQAAMKASEQSEAERKTKGDESTNPFKDGR